MNGDHDDELGKYRLVGPSEDGRVEDLLFFGLLIRMKVEVRGISGCTGREPPDNVKRP